MSELGYEVFVSDGVRRNRAQRLPDGRPIVSSPLSTTLIFGAGDAVLVDPPFTYEQVRRVGDWGARFGKQLTHIYATHGHGDHWFGTDLLMQHFPDAIAYATEGTIRLMHKQATDGRAQLWDKDFPGLIPDSPVVYQPIPTEGFELEGTRMHAIETGQPPIPPPMTRNSLGSVAVMAHRPGTIKESLACERCYCDIAEMPAAMPWYASLLARLIA